MTKFVIFCCAFGLFNVFVNGEDSLQHENPAEKKSSGLSVIYKILNDVFIIKEELLELKNEISDHKDANSELSNEISELQAVITEYKNENSELSNEIGDLKSKIDEQVENNEHLKNEVLSLKIKTNKVSGATYVRWGRTVCPSVTGTVKIYDGFAAGDHYTHGGGGVDLLCLPRQPNWGKYSDSFIGNARIYGTEYEISAENSNRLFGKKVLNQNVPCVVCQSVGRLVKLRIPGRTSCYSGWTEEYRGYLFAGHDGHAKSTDYTCLDSDPESIIGKSSDQNGHLLYPVEAHCYMDSLPCPPYIEGRELACVVCTK